MRDVQTEMVGEVFKGELRGRAGSAKCLVKKVTDSDWYIYKVAPPLREGDYGLLVNRLVLKVRFKNHKWEQVTD